VLGKLGHVRRNERHELALLQGLKDAGAAGIGLLLVCTHGECSCRDRFLLFPVGRAGSRDNSGSSSDAGPRGGLP
jgi:hypothetical protein